jgi:DNA-binding transcriptional LysR family regulator
MRMRIVAAPGYLKSFGTPQHPTELKHHRCLNLRYPTSGRPYRWELSKAGKRMELDVEGPLLADEPAVLVSAALAGTGIAHLFETDVIAHISSGALKPLLDDWSPPFPGFHIYFPSRRGVSPVLRAFLDHMKGLSSA